MEQKHKKERKEKGRKMMKKFCLFLVSALFAFTLIACQTTTAPVTTTTTPAPVTTTTEPSHQETRVVNDTYTLLLQSSTMDGIFNPFFYSSAYDGDVVGLTNVGLLTTDETGAVVASDYYPTVAQSYSIYYTDDLDTYAEKASYEEGDYVVYEMVLKNDARFSDGTLIDADDVLFNYYVYLDPAYVGSSTLYTLPILGLANYRNQSSPDTIALNSTKVDAILTDDNRKTDYVSNAVYSEAEFDAYWPCLNEAGARFCSEIVNYVMANYATTRYVQTYLSPDLSVNDVKGSETLKIAFGMRMWGYASGKPAIHDNAITGASGTVYQIADLTPEIYFAEMLLANEDENGKIDYQGLSDYESAGGDFVATSKEIFTMAVADVGSFPNIAGLVKGTKVIDGETYETVKVILTEQNPKAILSLGVTVAPQHVYTSGYTYGAEDLKNAGVVYNSKAFMDHLATFNGNPIGAGPYKFVRVDSGDGTVYFERNTYFDTMGGNNVYNTNIKYVALKIVDSGAEYQALAAGDVAYATVSATSDVMGDLALSAKLVGIVVDNLGYGYICINPEVFPNLNFRLGLACAMNTAAVLEYYPSGLADLIYRSQSQVSWAYPEGATSMTPYDADLSSTIDYWKAAGFTFDEGTGKFTGIDPIDVYLPSEASAHPAGSVYLDLQAALATIGVTVNVKVDANLIANIKANPVSVYALAWQSTQDPDMYQVYHYLSQAESVKSNGIQWLYANGGNDELGTLTVTKLDGTTEEMNQREALEYLGYLIEEGTSYMLPEERKPIYSCALDLLAQLAIEVPTYQRKNLFVYDGTIIDGETLSANVTPYWGPMAEIWKLSFALGVQGNDTTSVWVPND